MIRVHKPDEVMSLPLVVTSDFMSLCFTGLQHGLVINLKGSPKADELTCVCVRPRCPGNTTPSANLVSDDAHLIYRW